jgi:branched-chain amino acid transport system permease protein
MSGMFRFTPKRFIGGLVACALLAAVAVLYGSGGVSMRQIATVMVLNAIMVVGTQIFVGNSGVLSFGHIGLVGVAAYITAILSAPVAVKASTIPDAPFGLAGVQLPVPLAILVAVVVTTILAALIGLFISRMNGIAASIVTFAVLIVVNSVLINWKSLTGGSEAFYGIPVRTNLWWGLLGVLVTVVVARLYTYSRVGLRVRALREDEVAARSIGVAVHKSRYVAWVLSAVFTALGGALYAHLLGAIAPALFYENLMFLQIAMLVLGGIYSVSGALVGVVVVTVISEALRWLGDGPHIGGAKFPMIVGLSSMAYGAILVFFMIWRPAGLLGDREVEDVWDWLKRRRNRYRAAPNTSPATSPAAPPIGVSSGASVASPSAVQSVVRPPDSKPILTVRDVSIDFAGLRAVDNVSIEVYPGEIVGLIGPNGAGKTTLLNLISGLYTAGSGEIVFKDRTVTHLTPMGIARSGVGRTFQTTRLFRILSVQENIEVAAQVAQEYRPEVYRPADEIMVQFGLKDVAQLKAGTLPYGIQRQVEMARAVALGPDLLLLDEPAAGTNDVESLQLIDSIRRVRDVERCAILLIDHDLPFVMSLCERIYVLDAAKVIAEGSPQEIQANEKVKEAYLGAEEDGPSLERAGAGMSESHGMEMGAASRSEV